MTLNGVEVLETVLRDGAQSRDVNIGSVKDALKIVKLIDGLGYADIIEAGFAGSHTMHDEIIKEAAQMDLHARVAAFCRTRQICYSRRRICNGRFFRQAPKKCSSKLRLSFTNIKNRKKCRSKKC